MCGPLAGNIEESPQVRVSDKTETMDGTDGHARVRACSLDAAMQVQITCHSRVASRTVTFTPRTPY